MIIRFEVHYYTQFYIKVHNYTNTATQNNIVIQYFEYYPLNIVPLQNIFISYFIII